VLPTAELSLRRFGGGDCCLDDIPLSSSAAPASSASLAPSLYHPYIVASGVVASGRVANEKDWLWRELVRRGGGRLWAILAESLIESSSNSRLFDDGRYGS
jgi:hypothetical protein